MFYVPGSETQSRINTDVVNLKRKGKKKHQTKPDNIEYK